MLLVSSACMAQLPSLGIKAGYITTNLSTDRDSITSGLKNNLTYGAFVRLNIKRFYIQPELMVSNVESDIKETSVASAVEGDASVHFESIDLEVPVMFGYRLLDLGLANLRVEAGPTLNYSMQNFTLSQVEGESDPEPIDKTQISWGAQVGVGADVLGFLTLDIRYNYGLTNAINDLGLGNRVNTENINVSDARMNKFMVTVGLKL